MEMGLHQRSTLSLFLFALVIDVLTRDIQDEVSWCILFVDDMVLIDKTHSGINVKLECGGLNKTLTEYVECKFNDAMHEIGIEVRPQER